MFLSNSKGFFVNKQVHKEFGHENFCGALPLDPIFICLEILTLGENGFTPPPQEDFIDLKYVPVLAVMQNH